MEKDENLVVKAMKIFAYLPWVVTIQLPIIGDLFGKCVSYQTKSLDC